MWPPTAGCLCSPRPSAPLVPPPWLLLPRRDRPRPRAPPRRSRRSSGLARMATGSPRSSEGGRPSRARRARLLCRSDCCRCGATPSVGLHSRLDADIERRRGCRLVFCVDGKRLQRGSRRLERARAMHSVCLHDVPEHTDSSEINKACASKPRSIPRLQSSPRVPRGRGAASAAQASFNIF